MRTLAAVIAAIAVSGCGKPAPAPRPDNPPRPSAADLKTGYDRLREGMTHAEATQAMGGPGKEQNRMARGDTETVWYIWGDPTAANVTAWFTGDRLEHKEFSPGR